METQPTLEYPFKEGQKIYAWTSSGTFLEQTITKILDGHAYYAFDNSGYRFSDCFVNPKSWFATKEAAINAALDDCFIHYKELSNIRIKIKELVHLAKLAETTLSELDREKQSSKYASFLEEVKKEVERFIQAISQVYIMDMPFCLKK
jgi:hypothetical protein